MDSTIWAEQALSPGGWARDGAVTVSAGRIRDVKTAAPRRGREVGCLLPAPVNRYCHTLPRAMACMAERSDSFRTWRDLMYRFPGHPIPDGVQAIAAQAGDTDLYSWSFTFNQVVVSDTWSAFCRVVQGGQLAAREAVAARFRTAMARLRGRA